MEVSRNTSRSDRPADDESKVRRGRVTESRGGGRSVDGSEVSGRVRTSSRSGLRKVEESDGNAIKRGSNRSADNATRNHSPLKQGSKTRRRRHSSRDNIELQISDSDPDDEVLDDSQNNQSGRSFDDRRNSAAGLDDSRGHRTSAVGRRRKPADGSNRSHSPKRDSKPRSSRRQSSRDNIELQLSESDEDGSPSSKPRRKRGSRRASIEDDEINDGAKERKNNRNQKETQANMNDDSRSSLEGSASKIRFVEPESTTVKDGERGNKMSDNSRSRDRKDVRKLADDTKSRDRRDGRRMSDDSKNRERRKDDRRMSEESSRRDREVRRHPEGTRRTRKTVTERDNRDKDGRRMKDDSDVRRRRRRNDQDADLKRERRERVMRSKDAYIPPPSHSNDEAEAKDHLPSHGSWDGPGDMAPSEHRPSRINRRPHRSPQDLPPPAEPFSEEHVAETTWQRGGPSLETSWHRGGQKRQPRRSHVGDLGGVSSRLANSPTAAPRRQAGRLNRGANVRQSQLVHMVQLQGDDYEPSDEIHQLSEIEEAQLDGEEEDSHAEPEPGITSSEHHHSNMRSLGKAAVKASAVVAKTSASAATSVAKSGAKVAGKAATSGAKAAGKAATSGAKAAGKAVKGVLGFRKKKRHYADPESAAAGLIVDDLQDSGGHLDMRDTEEDFGHDSSGEYL